MANIIQETVYYVNTGKGFLKLALLYNLALKTNTAKLYCEFTLPWPPSVNNYVRAGQGRHYLKKEVVLYRELVAGLISPHISIKDAAFKLELHFHPKTRRKFDLDNFLKQPIDALMHAGLFTDDSQLVELQAFKHSFDSNLKGYVNGLLFLA